MGNKSSIKIKTKKLSQKIKPKMEQAKNENNSFQSPFAQTYFHGTKADLKIGDLIEIGINSNYGQRNNAKYIYLTATLDAAIWGAELALGNGKERI
ncbi:MAG TPA: NAD(+)--rifampin ADP-ribosyltransferase, partial [Adhaeribacter sp.]|nr:NAD(+)--rifampin ADP-ribosyltransferase [Adhaeribacter sp.]